MSLTKEQREELELLLAAKAGEERESVRIRVILALDDGMTYSQIKRELHTTGPTISRWKRRYVERGVAGLIPRFRGGVRKQTTEEALVKLRECVGQQGPELSCRELAKRVGVSKSTVQRLLKVMQPASS